MIRRVVLVEAVNWCGPRFGPGSGIPGPGSGISRGLHPDEAATWRRSHVCHCDYNLFSCSQSTFDNVCFRPGIGQSRSVMKAHCSSKVSYLVSAAAED